ncbi:hypothetical protein BH18ACI5_BH18ACI5_04330 [soil metagenome]
MTLTAQLTAAARGASRDDSPDAADSPRDTWPAPLRQAAYHGVFGAVIKAIEPETEADPAAILLQILAMFGSVIGRTAHYRVEADVHYLMLNVGVVGNTAKGRKGISRGRAQRLFEPVDPEWTRECITSGLSSGEGLIHHVRDPIEKEHPIKKNGRVTGYETVVEDPGVDDKRLLVIESELASTLKTMSRDGNTLSAVVRQAWDGHDLRTLTKSSSTKATAPHIGIIGHITRDELRRYLDATECANGFGNRSLWVCVRRSKELPDGGRPVDLTWCSDDIQAAVTAAKNVTEMRRDTDARSLWHQVYGRLSAGRPGLLGAMTARAEAQVMRLACLYALGDRLDVVRVPHLRAALEVWRYCFDSTAYIFGDRLGDPVADEILNALRAAAPESLTRKEISHVVLGKNRSSAEITRALTMLLESRLARFEKDRSGEGRPAERWFVEVIRPNDLNDLIACEPGIGRIGRQVVDGDDNDAYRT